MPVVRGWQRNSNQFKSALWPEVDPDTKLTIQSGWPRDAKDNAKDGRTTGRLNPRRRGQARRRGTREAIVGGGGWEGWAQLKGRSSCVDARSEHALERSSPPFKHPLESPFHRLGWNGQPQSRGCGEGPKKGMDSKDLKGARNLLKFQRGHYS